MNRRGFILGGCAALAVGMKALAAPTRSAVAARHIMGGNAAWTPDENASILVSGALFRNAGTGAFTIGPDKN